MISLRSDGPVEKKKEKGSEQGSDLRLGSPIISTAVAAAIEVSYDALGRLDLPPEN